MKNSRLKLLVALVACLFAITTRLDAKTVEIRMAYGGVPGVISPVLFQKPEILKHYGKSYTLKPTYIAATSTAMQGLASGDFDLSYLSFTALASAIANGGLDLKVISDITQWGGHGYEGPQLVVKADSGINSIKDLKGKVLALTGKGTGFHYALLAQLKQAGLKPSDYTIVEVGRAALDSALREGRADLVVSSPPFLGEMERKGGVKRLGNLEEAMGTVQSLVMVGNSSFLTANADAVRDFLEDYIIGLTWFLDPKNHDEAVKLTSTFTKLPPEMFEYAYTKVDFYRSPTATPDIVALQRNIDLMQELGIIKQKVEVKPYIDLSYLDEAKRRLGVQ
jgi:sulfonate transport system substrate-binding protein